MRSKCCEWLVRAASYIQRGPGPGSHRPLATRLARHDANKPRRLTTPIGAHRIPCKRARGRRSDTVRDKEIKTRLVGE